MPLTQDQYDSIMAEYAAHRAKNRRALAERRNEVARVVPEYRDLERQIADTGFAALKERLAKTSAGTAGGLNVPASGTAPRTASYAASFASSGAVSSEISADYYQKLLAPLEARRKALLTEHGFPENYLELTYDCPDCKDTGYADGQKCHCLRAREISVLYDQSNLRTLAGTDNFDLLSEEWYAGEDRVRFHKAAEAARDFADHFDREPGRSFYFFGTVGTGKSFLSVCVADRLIRGGHSVLYFSAIDLFAKIGDYRYDYRMRDMKNSFTEDLCGCDLLIIDDLGTEQMTSQVPPDLFRIVNERQLGGRSTIISSNLSLEELRDRYSDRVFSRVASFYEVYKFSGRDIRLQKKLSTKH